MISFVSIFLGLVLGPQVIQVAVSPPVAYVELSVDGELIGELDGEPWAQRYDFGDEIIPRELVAVAYDGDDNELGQARQWLNLPRPPAEVEMVLEEKGQGGPRRARLTWESLVGVEPTSVHISFDAEVLPVTDPRLFELPPHDPEQLHFLRAELEFGGSITSVAELIFGGIYADRVSTELTAIPIRVEKGIKKLSPEQLAGWFTKGGTPLPVAAVERGTADIVMVRDSATQKQIDAVRRHGGMRGTSIRSQGSALGATRRDRDWRLQFLWPVTHRRIGAGATYDLFPHSHLLTDDDGDLHRILTWFRQPSDLVGDQRLADAVAVAGLSAAEGKSRRAVVLLLSHEPEDASHLGPGPARRYLERLQVPLFVWTISSPESEISTWGEVHTVSTYAKLVRAWRLVRKEIKRQRIVWIEGVHLPQDIALSPEAEGIHLVR